MHLFVLSNSDLLGYLRVEFGTNITNEEYARKLLQVRKEFNFLTPKRVEKHVKAYLKEHPDIDKKYVGAHL